jgi:hypothetical protein
VSTFVVSLPFLSSPDSPGYLGCLLAKQFGKSRRGLQRLMDVFEGVKSRLQR